MKLNNEIKQEYGLILRMRAAFGQSVMQISAERNI
jgi:hypothetical protein